MSPTVISEFIGSLDRFPIDISTGNPWQVIGRIDSLVQAALENLPGGFEHAGDQIALHRCAVVAASAVLTGPVIVSAGARIGPGAILRNGVWADEDVTVGPHSEIKASLVFAGSAATHRNYVGDSIIGQNVNLEAGAVLANHFNERADKRISVLLHGQAVATGLTKFGALAGDNTRIGANAVTSPGTLLPPHSVVPRLGLVDQMAASKHAHETD